VDWQSPPLLSRGTGGKGVRGVGNGEVRGGGCGRRAARNREVRRGVRGAGGGEENREVRAGERVR
jgi:hypothetical protein